MEIEVIPQPPARPHAPAFDPVTGVLVATAEQIERLLAMSAEPELEAAGAVVGGRAHPALRPALAAVADPSRVLVVERGDGMGRAWIADGAAALALPAGDGRLGLVAVRPDRVAEAIAAACGLDASRGSPPGEPVRARADELARQIAVREATAVGVVTSHWRVTEAGTAVEVIDTEAGAWLVVPGVDRVELRPAAGAEIVRLLDVPPPASGVHTSR